MYYYVSKEQQEAQKKQMMDQFKQMLEESKRKSDAREAWKKNNPPCPHCGQQREMPFWMTV